MGYYFGCSDKRPPLLTFLKMDILARDSIPKTASATNFLFPSRSGKRIPQWPYSGECIESHSTGPFAHLNPMIRRFLSSIKWGTVLKVCPFDYIVTIGLSSKIISISYGDSSFPSYLIRIPPIL